jgi:hypothetical protein
METIPVVLFPHSVVMGTWARRILTLFGPLSICQPWHLKAPDFLKQINDATLIGIIHPPAAYHPGEGFPRLLAEHRGWLATHPDTNTIERFKVAGQPGHGEDSTWEIRSMIRPMVLSRAGSKEGRAVRWHLILHLFREFEAQRTEADQLLHTMKSGHSPLQQLVEEEEELPDLLGDLPRFEKAPFGGENSLKQILVAWFSLFGDSLQKDSHLMTLDSLFMDYVGQLWEESAPEGRNLQQAGKIRFRIPDLAERTWDAFFHDRRRMLEREEVQSFIQEMKALHKKPFSEVAALRPLFRRLEEFFAEESASDPALRVTVRHLPPLRDTGLLEKNGLLVRLQGKTIIHLEKDLSDA